jgi:polysaccharide export outer membrane protein
MNIRTPRFIAACNHRDMPLDRPGRGLLRRFRLQCTGAIVLGVLGLLPAAASEAAEKMSNMLSALGTVESSVPASLLTLGIGDAISVQVYGRPELNITTYVSDDGTVPIPLAGNVAVEGLSPSKAGSAIASAFRKGNYLVDPQVTVLLVQFRSQQVSVLGAVRTPGRFVVESRTTVLDLLAQAGGTTEDSSDVVVLLRPDKAGKVTRQTIDLKGLSQSDTPLPTLTLRGGDSVFVPPAEQFSIYGEIRTPNMYRLESNMTVVQAIARGGGITPRGSSSRIEIKRRKADGSTQTQSGKLGDEVRAGDVIRIKERIF